MEERVCWVCKEKFPLSKEFFYLDKRNKKGYQAKCKKCSLEFSNAYRKKHPEYSTLKSYENYDARKMKQPDYNSERYKKRREDYLLYRKVSLSTVEGRLHNAMFTAKSRAKEKNMDFDLDKDFLIDLLHKQENCCKLTGLPLTANDRNETFFSPLNPSIDRIDPNKGYTKDNIQIVCTAMNLALNQFGEEFFYLLATSYLEKKQKID